MKAAEISAALAALSVGLYLVASSLGVLPLQLNLLLGLALAVFGVSYMAAGRSRESAFWGGVLAIVGVAAAGGGQGDPLLLLGVLLIFVALFALLASRRGRPNK